VTRNETVIVQAGLGNPNLIADYDYWSRMEWLDLDEAVWLVVGLDPRRNWPSLLSNSTPGRRPGLQPELNHVKEQLTQLSRFASNVCALGKRFKGPELLNWIVSNEYPAHPDFVKMLQVKLTRSDHEVVHVIGKAQADSTPNKEDPRAVRAVARIIAAIAIEEYGYNPDVKRSPIPAEIVAIMDRLGLQGTSETVLKYLKIGASELPPGWNGSDN
jgi:hypothetical protein